MSIELLGLLPPMLTAGKGGHSVELSVEYNEETNKADVKLLLPKPVNGTASVASRTLAKDSMAPTEAAIMAWVELVGPAVGAKLDAMHRRRT